MVEIRFHGKARIERRNTMSEINPSLKILHCKPNGSRSKNVTEHIMIFCKMWPKKS